jgi:uncharacterized membrane protein
LAISDFFIGSFCIPQKLICEHALECSDTIWEVLDTFISFFLTTSTTNLCMISLDRYISAVHPFFYQRSICDRSWVLILLSWVLSVLQEIPFIIWNVSGQSMPQANIADTITKLLFLGIIPPILMIYTYIRVCIVLRKHKKAIKDQDKQLCDPRHIKVQRDIKKREVLLMTVAIMDSIYIVCSIVYQYVMICYLLQNTCNTSYLTEKIFFIIIYFHSLPNALIYAYIGRSCRCLP